LEDGSPKSEDGSSVQFAESFIKSLFYLFLKFVYSI